MWYLIPEVAPGDWAIEILEVQIPIYAPCVPTRGVGHNIDRCIGINLRLYHVPPLSREG